MVKCVNFLAVLALYSFVTVSCEPVKFKDCGSEFGKLEVVDVIPCPNQPCVFKKGTEATVEVKFTTKENVTKATTVVHGIIGGVPIPFPVGKPDACNDHGITCPMIPGKDYTFKTVLPVKSDYPSLRLDVEWELRDQNNKMVYCFEIAVQIE